MTYPRDNRLLSNGLGGRGRAVTLRIDGTEVPARSTDTIASAMLAAGLRVCRRTIAGDGRGVFCGMGICRECLVNVDGVDGLRACMTPVRDGMVVTQQQPLPRARVPAAPAQAAQLVEADLAVIGGGPAGLAAATAAAAAGVDALLVDERGKPGGQFYKQPAEELVLDARLLDRQYRAGRALLARAQAAGVRMLQGTRVWGAVDAHRLLASADGKRLTIQAQRLVVATGAYERGVPMPGWTLPGVMTTGAAQTLLRATQVSPGRRVLVSGHGPLNVQLAAELTRAGAEVVALAELATIMSPARAGALAQMAIAPDLLADGVGYLQTLRRARVPLLTGSAVIRVEGEAQAQRAVVARIDAGGNPIADSETSYAVDAVCLGFGFEPANELTRSLGCEHRWDAGRRQVAVLADARGRTSLPDVWVAGDAAGTGGARLAEAVGTLAGLDVARSLGRSPSGSSSRLVAARAHWERLRQRRFQQALWRVYAAPRLVDQLATPETPICRCESVGRHELEAAAATGIRTLGALKRATRAGMGGCQGRYCGPLLAEITARSHGRPLTEDDLFAPGTPYTPVEIDSIAYPSEAHG